MKKILLAFVACFMVILGFSQKDPEAESILKQAADKALAYKTIYTTFKFVVENTQNESAETYNGELWIKGSKFKMMVDNTVTFCDGKNRWVYLPEAEEVNVTTIEADDDLDPEERFLVEPLSIFTLYQKDFKYLVSGNQEINGKGHTVIDLSPVDLDKPYFKIKCWISASHDYHAIKYFQKDGTRITLEFKNLEVDNKYKESFFIFDSKSQPNVEVIDLRD